MAELCRHFAIAGVFGILVCQASAQSTTPPSPADLAKYDKNKNGMLDADELAVKQIDEAKTSDVTTLTPFEVSTSKDVGYAAGNTLSGGRVDTPLAITPGSISVITKEFMDDFNITDMNQAGSWSIGFDLGVSVPNSDPSSVSVYQNIVRGASPADNFPTRNGSINFGAADSYNTDRFEFQRGPDTSMFGDGGPGGRQGSSSKRASFNRTSASFTAQADTWNGYRSTIDYAKGWDRVGVRFNALYQNAPGYQSNTDKLKKAWTINVVGKLTKNTTVSVEYERANEWNSLWSITNGDTQNLWDGVSVNNDNSALLANNGTQLNALGLERLTVGANGSAPNMFIWNFATNSMMDYGGNQYRTRGLIYSGNAMRIPYTCNPYLSAIPARRASLPNMDPRFKAAPKSNIAARDTDTGSINLEHRIGNLFVRLGAVTNNFDNNTVWSNLSANAYIIDVNRLLPNGQLNPRFLQPFTDVEQNNMYSEDATKELNGLATYRFFVPRWWDYKQQLSLTVSNRDTTGENRTSAWRRVDNPTTTSGVTSIDPFNNANKFFYRVYWNDPRPDLAPLFTDPNKAGVPGTWKYVDTGGAITLRNVKQGSITSQSGFFNEKLVFTGSFSKTQNTVESQSRQAALTLANTPTYTNVLGNNGIAGQVLRRKGGSTSVAYGLVTYPFQFKKEGLLRTILSPLGFVVNVAQNTQAPGTSTQNPLITGEEPPLTHSETQDYGIRYSIPGGKAYFTLSHYKTTQLDNPAGFGSAGDITNIWKNLGYTELNLTTTTTGSGFAYSDPSSRRLEGWEAELTANPTRNVTLSINYSHPLTYVLSESEDRKAYIAAHRADWEAGAKAASGATLNGHVILDPGTIATALASIDNSLAGLTTGTLDNGTINHRINANGRYTFREGALKGLAVVAGVQYRGFQKSGSRDPRLKFNLPESATVTTLQNTQAAYDYLWVPPSWKSTITAGANYTRRFGKYQYRFQLNVANLLNNLDPIWGRSGPSGNGGGAYLNLTPNALFGGNVRQQILASFVNPDPRKFTFSTTVSF